MGTRAYKLMSPPATLPWLAAPKPQPERSDDSRRHAANWFVAVALSGYAVIAALWWACVVLNVPTQLLRALLPMPLLAAIIISSWRLLTYTKAYRDYRYGQGYEAQDADMPDDLTRKPGDPLPGTLLRGVDGRRHRIDIELDEEEIRVIKKYLINTGAFNVRALMPILGETRPSALRTELHQLGILTQPKGRAVAKLTEAGRKAVMRW